MFIICFLGIKPFDLIKFKKVKVIGNNKNNNKAIRTGKKCGI